MSTSFFTQKKKLIATLLLGVQVFLQLLAPVGLAYAQTPEVSPSTKDNVPTQQSTEETSSVIKYLKSTVTAVKDAAANAATAAVDAVVGNLLKFIGWFIFEIAGKFLQVMALILDYAIDKTVDSQMYKGLSAIQVGWTAIRDISNMFFIFVLLYISIQTILGLAGSNTKRWVAHLIIAALLINFSLYFTQVVVDAGNILTVGFWNNMKTTQANGGTSQGFAPILFEGLRIQTVFDGGEGDNLTKAKIYFGGAIVMFIAGYVALAGAIMMIIRTVTLIILMIVSPFAFLGFSLPKGGGFAHKWLDKLLGATFVAPVFVMMLYLNMIIIRSLDIKSLGGAGATTMNAVFSGSVDNFAIIYNFLVVIILMLASLTVSQSISAGVGSQASGWAKKALGTGGGVAIGASAIALRRTVGAGADKLKNSKGVQEAAQRTGLKGMMARATIRSSNAVAKSSLDLRNAPGMKGLGGMTGVNFGAAGGAGGARGQRQASDQAIIKRAEELFPNNPAAQQNYIRNATRTLPDSNILTKEGRKNAKEAWGKAWNEKELPSRLNQKPGEFASKEDKALKDKNKTLEQEAKKKEAEKTIKEQPAEYEKLKADLETLRASGASQDKIKEGEKALEAAVTKMTDALKTVGSKHFTELTLDNSTDGLKNQNLLKSEVFQKSVGSEHLKTLEGREDVDQAFLDDMRNGVLAKGGKRSRDYLVRQMRNEDSRYHADHKAALKNEISSYQGDYKSDSKQVGQYDTMMGGGSPLDATQQAEYDTAKERMVAHRKSLSTRLGYMTPAQVAELDQADILNDATVSGLTPAMLKEIEKSNLNLDKNFFSELGAKIKNDPAANPAAKKYVENAQQSKKSPFNPAYT